MISCIFFAFLLFQVQNCYSYITWIEPRLPLQGIRAPPGTPWPAPQVWKRSDNILFLNSTAFKFTSNAENCDIIRLALTRYRELIFGHYNVSKYPHDQIHASHRNVTANVKVLRGLNVLIDQPQDCSYPQLGNDESYKLEILFASPSNSTLRSNTVWGALRGLETFSQLVYLDSFHLIVNSTLIEDYPAYKYRGLMLDTARHFIPLKTLLLNLDAMAYNKFNVFHWHLVDDQAFPYQSKKFPQLSVKGAYSPRHVYTQEDVKLLIDYARMRGIRVIPEIDTPGHTKVFEKAFPELLTPCYGEGPDKPYTPKYPEHSEAETLHPLQNRTYQFMLELYQELKEVFKDEFIHLGMDEVYYACWKSNPDIQNFMRERNLTEMWQVEQHYVRETLKNVKTLNLKYMIWQDPVDNGVKLAPDSLVEVWKDTRLDPTMKSWEDYIRPIASQGYNMVLSSCWYLNYIRYPYPGRDWEEYYLCDPRSFTTNTTQQALVVGGEACQWAEFSDATNLLSRIWPRASAVAERLWTNPIANDVDSARFRLDQFRCRMVERGIPAAPILNGYCGNYEWENEKVKDISPGDRVVLKH